MVGGGAAAATDDARAGVEPGSRVPGVALGAEFATLRLRLVKIAARVVERATRIRVSLPTAFPERAIFALIACRLAPRPP